MPLMAPYTSRCRISHHDTIRLHHHISRLQSLAGHLTALCALVDCVNRTPAKAGASWIGLVNIVSTTPTCRRSRYRRD